MLGVRLFVHAFTMLFHDVWATMRLILFPLLIGAVLVFGLFITLAGSNPFVAAENISRPQEALAGVILPSVLSMFVTLFVICWSAVGWHRYVLLQERPDVFLPKLNLPFLGAYLWAGVKVFLLAMALLIPVLFLLLPFISWIGGGVDSMAFPLVMSVVSIAVSVIFFRITLILPAAAVGKPLKMGESWKATEGYFWAFVIVAIASTILNYLAGVFGGEGIVGLALLLLLNLLSFAMGISILTTLYGACIEKRELT